MNMFGEENKIEKVAVYTRVSTDEQADRGFSLDAQLNKLKGYCESYDLKIIKVYVDDGYTGRNTRRPRYQDMMDDISKWDGILVLKMDRIHRNQKNFLEMMDFLAKNNKQFISMQEKMDTSTAMGRFVMNIIQGIAQLESEQIGERVALALVQKAKNSDNLMGHRLPYGYKWKPGKPIKGHKWKKEPGTLIPVPDELDVVKHAFELYNDPTPFDPIESNGDGYLINTITGNSVSENSANRLRTRYAKEGRSFRAIAKIISREFSIKKSESSIRYYLNNIFYAGYERYCHYFRKINNGFQPIISAETWNNTQNKMRSNSRTHEYDPILIPDGEPETFKLNSKQIDLIPTINRAKHNYVF